jgi:hypothetical protein
MWKISTEILKYNVVFTAPILTKVTPEQLSLVFNPYIEEVADRLKSIQGVSRLVDITAGGDFLGLCDQKSSY